MPVCHINVFLSNVYLHHTVRPPSLHLHIVLIPFRMLVGKIEVTTVALRTPQVLISYAAVHTYYKQSTLHSQMSYQ